MPQRELPSSSLHHSNQPQQPLRFLLGCSWSPLQTPQCVCRKWSLGPEPWGLGPFKVCSEGRGGVVWLEELCMFVWALHAAVSPVKTPLMDLAQETQDLVSPPPCPRPQLCLLGPRRTSAVTPCMPPTIDKAARSLSPHPPLCHTPVMGKVGVADQGGRISCLHKSPQRALLSTYPECCDLVAENSRG